MPRADSLSTKRGTWLWFSLQGTRFRRYTVKLADGTETVWLAEQMEDSDGHVAYGIRLNVAADGRLFYTRPTIPGVIGIDACLMEDGKGGTTIWPPDVADPDSDTGFTIEDLRMIQEGPSKQSYLRRLIGAALAIF